LVCEDTVPVEVRIPTMLRSHVGGAATVEVPGATVGEVVGELVAKYPGLAGQVVTDDGTLHKFVNVYLNDDDIRYLSKLETKVGEGDTVSILPAVAGGL
jgi:molybdopterin synthase sulfur carrier subunit